jgi:transposase
VWRKSDQNIYSNSGSSKRKNLIAAIDENSVLTYTINDNNTDEKIFLEFMIKLKEKIDSMNIKDFVIILDNLASHKTPLLKEFYIKNKLNIIFNSPYQSMFNCIELFFRIIKRKLYQNINQSTDSAMSEVIKIISEEKLSEGLIKNFRETLKVYYNNSLNYKDINLNNLEIQE